MCKHAFKVFSVNDVFILPSQYILKRWTKYAKRGYYVEKLGTEEESLKTHAARVSRKATSVALKCTRSKELFIDFEKVIDKFDVQADNSLSKIEEKSNEVPLVSTIDTLKGTISIRVPQMVKGAKSKQSKNSFRKKKGKKKNSSKKKGTGPTHSASLFYYILL